MKIPPMSPEEAKLNELRLNVIEAVDKLAAVIKAGGPFSGLGVAHLSNLGILIGTVLASVYQQEAEQKEGEGRKIVTAVMRQSPLWPTWMSADSSQNGKWQKDFQEYPLGKDIPIALASPKRRGRPRMQPGTASEFAWVLYQIIERAKRILAGWEDRAPAFSITSSLRKMDLTTAYQSNSALANAPAVIKFEEAVEALPEFNKESLKNWVQIGVGLMIGDLKHCHSHWEDRLF